MKQKSNRSDDNVMGKGHLKEEMIMKINFNEPNELAIGRIPNFKYKNERPNRMSSELKTELT